MSYYNQNKNRIKHTDSEALAAQFVGKRVIAVDLEAQTLSLSDGTVLTVEPNCGECCGQGDFFLVGLAEADNAITRIEVERSFDPVEAAKEGTPEDKRDIKPDVYRLFVYAEGVAQGQEILEVGGFEGNGYYGTGFEILVS